MNKNILVVDNDISGTSSLVNLLNEHMPGFSFEQKKTDTVVLEAMNDRHYSLVIVDLGMKINDYTGLRLGTVLLKTNSFAKLLFLSDDVSKAFKVQLRAAADSSIVVDVVLKRREYEMIQELKLIIEHYYKNLLRADLGINNGLLQYYELAKNEKNQFQKGVIFESFMMTFFQTFGYKQVKDRIRESGLNEVDVIIRNEIDDSFLAGLGKYILIECRNFPGIAISAYDFVHFHTKVKQTLGLSAFGIFATTGLVSRNTFEEAMRRSFVPRRIVYLAEQEILILIRAEDKLEEFKKIIREQMYGPGLRDKITKSRTSE